MGCYDGGRCRPPEPFFAALGPPSLSPAPRHVSPNSPAPLRYIPPLKGCCHRRRDFSAPRHVFFSAPPSRLQSPPSPPPLAVGPPSRTPPSTGTPPRRPLPATPPMPNLLGEPRLHSLCPAQPPLSGGAGTEHLAAPRPSASPLPTRHRTAPGTRTAQ
jgi:hypothetical protein